MTEYEDSFESQSSSENASQASSQEGKRQTATDEATHPPSSAANNKNNNNNNNDTTGNHGRGTSANVIASQPLSNSSLEDTMSEERKRTALEAPSRAAFQQLSHFVAFGSGSAGTTPTTTPLDRPPHSLSTPLAKVKGEAQAQHDSFAGALVHTPVHAEPPTLTSAAAREDRSSAVAAREPMQGLLSPMLDSTPQQQQPAAAANISHAHEEEIAAAADTPLASADKSTRSLDQMSVISTLSQFMQKRQGATAAAEGGNHVVTSSTAPPLLLPPSSALAAQPGAAASEATHALATSTTNNNTSKPTLLSALTQLRLPELPPSSLAPRQEKPITPLRLGEQPLVFTTGSAAADIPPLPSAPGTTTTTAPMMMMMTTNAGNAAGEVAAANNNNNNTSSNNKAVQESQARVNELQATTEAVERLVKAFALLRGYPADSSYAALPMRWQAEDGAGSKESAAGQLAVATVGGANAYRPGAEATVRVSEAIAAQQRRLMQRQQMRLRALARHASPATALPSSFVDPRVGLMNEVNERLVEEVVLGCVSEMLAEAPTHHNTTKRKKDDDDEDIVSSRDAAHAQSPQLARELVTVDDFSVHGVSASSLRRRGWAAAAAVNNNNNNSTTNGRVRRLDDAYVFAEDAMHAFAPDGGPDVPEALYHAVREALHKYVLRHVIGLAEGNRAQRQDEASYVSAMTPVTPFFAWTLLIDLLAVCHDILASNALLDSSDSADAEGSNGRRPVWVRYCGAATERAIAAAAMHCLPFEVLPSAATHHTNDSDDDDDHDSPVREYAGRVFQLDYWVTGRAMWVIVEAVTDTLRAHIMRCAHVLDYDLFGLAGRLGPEGDAAAPLTPSPTPLFELVLPSAATQASSSPYEPRPRSSAYDEEKVASATMARRGRRRAVLAGSAQEDKASSAAYFGVNAEGLQSLTHAVSVLSTELMAHTQEEKKSSDKKAERVQRASGASRGDTMYDDLSRCTCETLCELMQDEAIRAAVARHTQEKYSKVLQERARANSSSLSKTELQRRAEELRRLARAEKEVEQVVERIRQEMTVRPLTS